MTNRPRFRLAPLLLAALLGASAAVAQSLEGSGERLVEDIVCWINDDIVTLSELTEQEQQAIASVLQNKNLPAEQLAQQVNQVRQAVLLQTIQRHLLLQEAEQLFDLDAVKEDLVKRFMEREGISTKSELDDVLANKYRMSRQDLEQTLLLMTMPEYVIDTQVRSTLGVSEEEARAYYEEHRDRFATKASVVFREIVLLFDRGRDREELESQARKIAAEAAAGADFGDLVQRYSEAPSKSIGGRIGPIDPGDLTPEIAEAVTSLAPGEVSAPIVSGKGIHIVRVEERQDAIVAPFEQVRDDCEQACRERKFQEALEKYLDDLMTAARIEVRADYKDRIPERFREKIAIR